MVAQLVSTLERVGQVNNFVKGMGLAAPQIGIGRAATVIRTPEGETVTLLNPRISDESAEMDEQYEGCLSFFDVRGMVPRPLAIEVEHQDIDGNTRITTFERGMARLVYHEVDHLFGVLRSRSDRHSRTAAGRSRARRPGSGRTQAAGARFRWW